MPNRTELYVNGKPAVSGSVVAIRGEEFILESWRPPHKASSSGFVYVNGREYYASEPK